MAYYSIYPIADTTIYSHPNRTTLNTGQDEILELAKERGNTDNRLYPSRILLKFDKEELRKRVTEAGNKGLSMVELGADSWPGGGTMYNLNKLGYGDLNSRFLRVFTASLELTCANAENITSTQVINVHHISQSWEEGTGRYSNLPTSSNGASWVYRDDSINETQWRTSSFATSNFLSTGNVSGSTVGATFASASIILSGSSFGNTGFSEPSISGSAHQLTINGIDFIPVISASLFNSSSTERYFDIGANINKAKTNLVIAINDALGDGILPISASNANIGGEASIEETFRNLQTIVLSGSEAGTIGNVNYSTSSIDGNDQDIFILGGSSSIQGGTDLIGETEISLGGGSYYIGGHSFQSTNSSQQLLSGENPDLSIDITEMVAQNFVYSEFISEFTSNVAGENIGAIGMYHDGYMLKFPDTIEANTSQSIGFLQYFSVDTHTIFPPKLTFKWDDSVHNYQSSAKTSGDLDVSLYGNKKEYNINDEVTFRIHVRDKYPTRQFASSSNYLDVGYLTTSSFYSVRDAHTEREIIPFDTANNKLSADSEGMYFKLWMNSFQPERYYRILFRHQNNDGITTYDNNYYFKVIR